jgi:tRNA threonylcarbamoyladenosine biosynthesis protein TsaB
MEDMKILAVDTSTASCSVAIISEEEPFLTELTTVDRKTHSKHLMNRINSVCDLSGIEVGDLDGFAVTVGPGSFTGLRIGVSTIKGLAWALEKPVVGISSLDALAWQSSPCAFLVCPILDARKNEVYFCKYRFKRRELQKEGSEQVAAPVEALGSIQEPCVFVGNGALLYQEKIKSKLGELAHFGGGNHHIIRASSVAGLSLPLFSEQKTDDVALLVPHYIRKSDAELKNSKKDN